MDTKQTEQTGWTYADAAALAPRRLRKLVRTMERHLEQGPSDTYRADLERHLEALRNPLLQAR